MDGPYNWPEKGPNAPLGIHVSCGRVSPRVPMKTLEATTTLHVNPPRFFVSFSKFQSSPPLLASTKISRRRRIRHFLRNLRAYCDRSMEKKELLGVRKSPLLTKRRRKVTAGGGGRNLAKAVAAYLASDSFMYAPLVSNSPPPPAEAASVTPSSLPPGASPADKKVTLAQKYRGSWRGTFAAF
uniref:Uncharacterized protein n=1 Tax=Leersia perrieri TaxID=77586 RepID=A0A0D9X8E2_9ORYZ